MSTQPIERRDAIFDPDRLAAVAQTALAGTESEPAFDDLTRMAALVVEAPLAFATIVDDVKSYWKSCYGVDAGGARANTVEESFCQYVVRSASELIVTDASLDPRTRENPSVASMGVRAWLGFPVFAPDGAVLGSFCVVDVVPRAWTARDIEVTRTCAAAASREIHLRDLVRRERAARGRAEATALALQASLLPPVLPEIPGLDVAARFRSAGEGVDLVGDFYDLFASRDGSWNLIVGDVCGKGVRAAELAAFVRHSVGAIEMHSSGPAKTLWRLNDILLERSPVPDRFLSAVCASFYLQDGTCYVRLARAGHPSPIVRRADGRIQTIAPPGQLVGLFPDVTIEEAFFQLDPGELLIVFTDGVDEARTGPNAPIFGLAALEDVVRRADPFGTADSLARAVEGAALAFSGGTARDDIAVVVVAVPQRKARPETIRTG